MSLMCKRACAHGLVFTLLSTACGGLPRLGSGRDAAIVSRSAQSGAFQSTAGAELALTLNLPAFRLEVRRGPELLRAYRVAIGMREYPTPQGSFSITHIEWNPWWIPPDRDWARHERVTPPGTGNPMGKVKLYFRPLYFLHGTPLVSSIGSAASHGCVRMRNDDAIDLALLIHAADLPAVSAEKLDSLQNDQTMTRMFPLNQPVPLQVTYQVAEVRADSLFLYADVYNLGPATVRSALLAMAATGVDTTTVRRDLLASAARDARRATVGVSLDSLTMRRSKD